MPFVDPLWTATTPIRFVGTWFSHVMTVVRLRNGSVLLHSPCRPSRALLDSITAIGPVTYVVAPNWFHDLYLRDYRAFYPNARFWGPRFLQRQYPALIDDPLDVGPRAPWADELPYTLLSGLLSFDEAVFFHVATATLIVADLLTNASTNGSAPLFTRLGYRFFGLNGRLKIFPLLRWLGFTSRASLQQALSQIATWNPDRLIVGHGSPVVRRSKAVALGDLDTLGGGGRRAYLLAPLRYLRANCVATDRSTNRSDVARKCSPAYSICITPRNMTTWQHLS